MVGTTGLMALGGISFCMPVSVSGQQAQGDQADECGGE